VRSLVPTKEKDPAEAGPRFGVAASEGGREDAASGLTAQGGNPFFGRSGIRRKVCEDAPAAGYGTVLG